MLTGTSAQHAGSEISGLLQESYTKQAKAADLMPNKGWAKEEYERASGEIDAYYKTANALGVRDIVDVLIQPWLTQRREEAYK